MPWMIRRRAVLLLVWWSTFAVSSGAADQWAMTVLRHGVPDSLVAGTRVLIPVVVRNDGTEAWDPRQNFALSYHWLDRDGNVIRWDGVRTKLPSVVARGEQVFLDAELEAPTAPGDYRLQWDVVQEGVRWLSEAAPSAAAPIEVVVQIGHAFSVTSGGAPRWLAPGAEVVRSVELRNDGSIGWRTGGGFALSYHWFETEGEVAVWDGLRSRLDSPVDSGGSIEVELAVRAPMDPGWYRLQLDMVEEGVTWFSRSDPSPEPRTLVLVASFPSVTPAAWSWTILALLAAILLVARREGPGWALAWLSATDLVWCAGSLAVMQGAVLAEAGQNAEIQGWLLVWAGSAALLLPLLALPGRFRPWLSLAIVAVAKVVLFADLLYVRFFGDILSLAAVAAAGQAESVRASIWSLISGADLWWWADLAIGVGLVLVITRIQPEAGRRWQRPVAVVLLVLVMAGVVAFARLARSEAGVLRQVFRSVFVARELGVINFHLIDVGGSLVRRIARQPLTDQQLEQLVSWFADRAPSRAGTPPWFGAASGMNLLMVQVESLQGFVLGLEVNGQQVTPFLNRWIERALVFRNVTDQTAQGRSSDAELTTQVSLLPSARGAAAFRYPGNRFTGLAAILADRGYSTMSAVPFDGGFWNRRATHAAYGYRQSLFDADFEPAETIGWGLNDRAFVAQMVPRLGELEQPFCVWMLTLGLHHPFGGFPDHHKLLELGAWDDTPIGNFLHTMHFFDQAFEELISGLDRHGLAESTVVVLWGDHDAGLAWEPQLAQTAGQRFDDAGWYLSQQVPLLIHVPGATDLVGVRTVAAGHQDVTPTLLALVGVDPARYAFIGRNLLGDHVRAPVVGEYRCWQDGRLLYLERGPTLAEGECFDVATMNRVRTDDCREGHVDAARQVEASRLTLEYDLQVRLHRELDRRLSENDG
jgi:phosphoglycerol transferase MdoB-like AlkP superfamily enzyme